MFGKRKNDILRTSSYEAACWASAAPFRSCCMSPLLVEQGFVRTTALSLCIYTLAEERVSVPIIALHCICRWGVDVHHDVLSSTILEGGGLQKQKTQMS
jgi:hypothetical protein